MDEFLIPNASLKRLINEYIKYEQLIILVDFDNVLYDYYNIGSTHNMVIELAKKAQTEYLQTLTKRSMEVLEKANNEGRMVILLAGRPYHADPFIEHKISHAIADMGIDVVKSPVKLTILAMLRSNDMEFDEIVKNTGKSKSPA